MLKLHRLKIERFRDVSPCELVFHDGFNVLLGKNGSGKTTLLRLIAALYSIPLGEIASGEEFELEVEFRFASGSAITHIKRVLAQPLPTDNLSAGLSSQGYRLTVEVQFSTEGGILLAQQYEETPVFRITRNGVETGSSIAPFEAIRVLNLLRTIAFDVWGAQSPLMQELTGTDIPFRFDESLEVLTFIRGQRIGFNASKDNRGIRFFSMSNGPPHVEYQTRFMNILDENPDMERLVLTDSDLGFLRGFITLTGLRSARMLTERIEKKTLRVIADNPISQNIFSNFHFSFTRRDGSEFPQEHLSYGQKRLLVFLYCQGAFPQVMIADELVNGLHHDWIETCLDLIRDRQSFLSSQNPLLLDYLWFESREEVQKTFILCKNEPREDRDVLTWRNMSAEEAEVVHGAYQTGVQHVSEILKSQGLW